MQNLPLTGRAEFYEGKSMSETKEIEYKLLNLTDGRPVCPVCKGDGRSEKPNPKFNEAYFEGRRVNTCATCDGDGRIQPEDLTSNVQPSGQAGGDVTVKKNIYEGLCLAVDKTIAENESLQSRLARTEAERDELRKALADALGESKAVREGLEGAIKRIAEHKDSGTDYGDAVGDYVELKIIAKRALEKGETE